MQHPSILLNLGIARLRTDDPVLAEADLVRFLSEDSGAAPEELTSARDALTEARAKIGTLRVIASPPTARVLVDNKPVAVRAPTADGSNALDGGVAEARLKAGRHTVTVEAEGYTSSQQSIDVPAKSDAEVKVTLASKENAGGGSGPPPKPVTHSQTRTYLGYGLAGASGAALVVSGVMALRALSLKSDYEDRGSPETFQNKDIRSEGETFRTGADVVFVIALLAGAGAVVMLFTDIAANDVAQLDPHRRHLSKPKPPLPLLRW